MSIIIKGMDMPKSCGECKFESAQYVNNYCRRSYCILDADYEHCPLIEIDLVRCGECKWYNPWHANHTNIDGNHCRNIDRPMKPTDFCSYGERRADEL